MNLISIVSPQNNNNFPETFKYLNSDKILKALEFFNECAAFKILIHLTCR